MQKTSTTLAWWYSPLAVVSGLLPWLGGIAFAILTRHILWLAIFGVVVIVLAAAGAHVCRKAVNPVSAKHWLIAEPILFACYYVFSVAVMRYLFLR